MKNVLAIHDISCVGRCSLTVALPIVSGLGATCSLLPTALLSTHTGGFTGFTCLDLTDEMRKILAAWTPLNLKFDAVYSGFMASGEQIDIVKQAVNTYHNDKCVAVIDPVMADDGALYKIFDNNFVKKMGELIPFADVLLPNITEAALLANVEYKDGPYDKAYIENLLTKLAGLGAKNVVLTGVYFNLNELGAAVLNQNGTIDYCFGEKIEGSYHGTGDVFGSVITAELVNGKTLKQASQSAVDFVVAAIKATDPNMERRYGVDFEAVLANKLYGA